MNRANVLSCSGHTLPLRVPDLTQWLQMEGSNVTSLCGSFSYINASGNMTYINLENANITKICSNTLEALFESSVIWLNLAGNNLDRIPRAFESSNNSIEKLWLARNQVICDCDMVWVIDWIENSISAGGPLQDYQDVMCTGGKWDGTPVYKLDKVKMGCYPYKMATWIIAVSSAVSGLTAVLCVVLFITAYRKRILLRWLMYKHFGKLIGPDKMEDLTDMEFDAFLSYRYDLTASNWAVGHNTVYRTPLFSYFTMSCYQLKTLGILAYLFPFQPIHIQTCKHFVNSLHRKPYEGVP